MKSSVLKPPGGGGPVPSSLLLCQQADFFTPFFSLLSLHVQFEVLMNKHGNNYTDTLSMHINPAAYYCCKNVIKDKTCQLSNSLWTGNQSERPSGQLIHSFQDPTNCCFDHFCAIFRLMTSPGIHVNKVPTVVGSMHIEVGVGCPCLDCAFLTWCKAGRPQADSW